MFDEPRYSQNQLSLILFPPSKDVRRKAIQFEEKLKDMMEGTDGGYFPAVVHSVPDELDPQIPRVTFNSEHSFSSINISQASIVLTIGYSDDWQTDSDKRNQYIMERIPVLFGLKELLIETQVLFCGFSSLVHLPTLMNDTEIIRHLSTKYFHELRDDPQIYDLELKRSFVIDDKYFNTISIANYRSINFAFNPTDMIPLLGKVIEQGIQIVSDFNDKYQLSQGMEAYRSSEETVRRVVELALDFVQQEAMRIIDTK